MQLQARAVGGLFREAASICVNDSAFFVREPAACGKGSMVGSQSLLSCNNVTRNVGRDKERIDCNPPTSELSY